MVGGDVQLVDARHRSAQLGLGDVVGQHGGNRHARANARARAQCGGNHADGLAMVGHRVLQQAVDGGLAVLGVIAPVGVARFGLCGNGHIGGGDVAGAGRLHVGAQHRHNGADAHTGAQADACRRADHIDGDGLVGLDGDRVAGDDRSVGDLRDHGVVRVIRVGVLVQGLGVLDVLGVLLVHPPDGLRLICGLLAVLVQPDILGLHVQVLAAALLAVVIEVFVGQVLALVAGGGVDLAAVGVLAAHAVLTLIVAVAGEVFGKDAAAQLAIFVLLVLIGEVLGLDAALLHGVHEGFAVEALPLAVAVGNHVGGILAHLRAGGQHHHGHARADAAGGQAGRDGGDVALAVGFHIHCAARSRRVRRAAQFGGGIALHDTHHGVHARGDAGGSGERRAGRT